MVNLPRCSRGQAQFGLALIAVTLCNLLLSINFVFVKPASAADPAFPDPAFQKVWNRTDKPIADGATSRTWLWGPNIIGVTQEPYAESSTGTRIVVYFDKTRMEITYPDGDKTSPYFVTNGLLAKELMSGQLQLGDNTFQSLGPALVGVAGDPDDTLGPTYATLGTLLAPVPAARKTNITDTLDRAGQTGNDPALGGYRVNASNYIQETGHNLADPFWEFLNSKGLVYNEQHQEQQAALFSPTFYATGFPVTEPFWTKVKVAGQVKDVLVQGFERRVLTYTPSNDPAFRVEMGNVGQHYIRWRYPNGIPSLPAPNGSNSLLMQNYIGINSDYKLYEDGTEQDFARVSKWIRDYVRMTCIEPSPNNFAGINGTGGCGEAPDYFNYNAFYSNMDAAGVNILLDTHESAGWANWTGKDDDLPPLKNPNGGQRPDDFLTHAQHVFQLAGLYGANQGLNPARLQTPDKQPGKNFVQAIETWNEPNGYWKEKGQFTKEQLYNMMVADYDGDRGRLPNAGIKQADPNMTVAMGGLSGTELHYLYGVLGYANLNGRDFPADVINVHEYATDGNQGITPEQAQLREHLERVVKWRNAYAPDKQVWITEFGWDTYREGSDHSGTWASLQNQANWLLRAYILYRAAGADKAFSFIYSDDNSSSTGLYDSSGLVTSDNEKKPSYYYLGTMQDLIGSRLLDRQLATGRDDVLNFAFKNPTSNNGVFVAWKTSGNGSSVSNFALQLPVNVNGSCIALTPSNNSFNPGRSSLAVNGNHQVTLTVSETPTFIQCSDVTGAAQVIPFNRNFGTSADGDGRIRLGPDDAIDTSPVDHDPDSSIPPVTALLDEQGGAGNPPFLMPRNYWYANTTQDSFAIDLHNSYNLSQLSWFNAGGQGGSYDVFYALPGRFGDWKPLTTITNAGDKFNQWQSVPLGVKAQYLRFVPKRDTPANLGEIAVYGTP